MVRKRIWIFSALILISLVIILGRLIQIQLIETQNFSDRNINLIAESVNQRSQEVILDHGRGRFYDRNMVPLTHEQLPSLIIFPFVKHLDWEIEKVAQIIGVPEERLRNAIENATEPFIFGDPAPLELTEQQMKSINKLGIPGVIAVEKQFERKLPLAAQLIGVTGENEKQLKKRYPDKRLAPYTLTGITGLEKSFDEFLLQEEKVKLVYHVDGKGNPLFGIDVKYVDPSNPFYPLQIQTTLDYDIQVKAEELVERHQIKKGGLILLDIESNSILASVSRPQMDMSNPFYNDGAKNMMLTAHIPGSVFKTVIAAAAIEHQIVSGDRLFDCHLTIHGEVDEQFNHGRLNFMNSFAASCNQTFATLAQELSELDPNIIETYAKKLGIIDLVGWEGDVFHFEKFRQLSDEETGSVFLRDEERHDKKLIRQTGIGQQSVRITPLSAANMMATIARGGDKQMVRAVASIKYKNGTDLYKFHRKPLKGETISSYTASKLQQMLHEVVKNDIGTGKSLQNLPYEVAGKSGTAQTYQFDEQGRERLNRWFVGYFPFQQPKYALAVVNLDVIDGEGAVTPLFKDLVQFLYEYDQKKKPVSSFFDKYDNYCKNNVMKM